MHSIYLDLLRLMDDNQRLRDRVKELENARYRYIGKDGKPILARELEDQRDEALEKLADAEARMEHWRSIIGTSRALVLGF